jgi:hypothetical protein
MKQQLSYLMGNDHNVKQFAEITRPLNIVQAILYACFGGFSVKEIMEAQRR